MLTKKIISLCIALVASMGIFATESALVGKFTVNANGDQVRFASGNLQYQASTQTWRFAAHQYDILGAANAKIAPDNAEWMDLFGWGTGDAPTKIKMREDYSVFTDWGNNPISNVENKPNCWRTLTKDEWIYIFSTRSDAETLRGLATVNNVTGYMLLPDKWVLPAGLKFTADAKDYATNTYSAAEWTKMEQAGAVFLPADGSRFETDIYSVGEYGYYQSATAVKERNDDYSFYFYFYPEKAAVDKDYTCYGCSVRLVK